MRAVLLFVTLLLFADYVLACPGCAGSMGNEKDARLVYILAGFIVLTYVPFYVLYRTIVKNRDLNLTPSSDIAAEVEKGE
jgi:hypothetical protein